MSIAVMPQDSISADTRARILDEAERLFRVYGYAKTTVSDIASACEMSPSNVYRFFASKAEINSAICERITSEKVRRITVIASSPASASDRILRIIADVYRFTIETLLDEKKVHEMVVVALEEQWSTVEAHLHDMTVVFEGVVRDGMRLGEFRQQDSAAAARHIMTAIVAFNHPTVAAQCLRYEHKSKPEEMAAFVLASLRA